MTDKPYDTRQNIRPTSYFDKEHRPTIRVDNKQITDLFNLVGNMNINEVKQFMIMEQLPFSVVDNNNNTLIHRVLLDSDLSKTETQRLQMIKYLFNENVNPDGPNNNNLTPLHIACSKQYYHIIEYLIEIGVNVNYQDNFGNTPLHRLFSGGIKIEEKTTIGNLIPKPKKKDSVNTKKWIEERGKIWKDINKSDFIIAIDETLKNSIGSDEEEIKVVTEFQQQLSQIIPSLEKTEEIKKLKEIQAASVHKFKKIIEKRWGTLPNIEDIMIHPSLEDSFPFDDPSKLAVIKNSDTNNYIRGKLYSNIKNIILLLQNFKNDDLKFDSNAINRKLLQDYLTAHSRCLISGNMLNDHTPHYNDYNNKFKHNASFDFADNIIDTDAKTFIGGARNILIINNVDNNVYQELFASGKDINYIIPTILYTILVDFNIANTFRGTFNILSLTPLSQMEIIIELLSDIINNKLTREKIIAFKALPLFNFQTYLCLHTLLDNLKEDTNIIGWIYCFINNFLCELQLINSGFIGSNLKGTINLSIIYLIAGMINNKGGDPENLILSISQSMRKSLYNNIFNEATNRFGFLNINLVDLGDKLPGCLISALIYLIFATDYTELLTNITTPLTPTNIQTELFTKIDGFNEPVELKFIMKYSYLVMNNIPIPDEMNLAKLPIYTNLEPREILVSIISKYYDSMEQPPQMQMVSDIIDLIRKKKDIDEPIAEELIINRFRHLIQTPISDIALFPLEPADIINPNLTNMINNMRTSKYFTIIGDNNNASQIWNITNNSLPSRVNYYLSLPSDNNRNNIIMYTLKFIESYYLGLNFLGQTQCLQIIDHMMIGGARLDTHYNLFNFDNHVDGAGLVELTNFRLFYTNTDRYYNRPTTIMSVINTLLNTETNLNKLINILVQKLLLVFSRMNKDKGTSLYATAISYLYPDLLILNNYSKIFESINKTFQSYQTILKEIETSTTIDINDNLTNFQVISLNRFQSFINQINGYIYLLHYFNSETPKINPKIKIPSFIYHTLGNDKPLIIYNGDLLNLLNPNSNTNDNETDTTKYDQMKGHINRDIGFFSNVINNIGYTTKETLKNNFIISKNKKLPPSLSVVLIDFYRLNIIETIKNNKTIIDTTIINIDINESNKNIQLLYLKSKIIEELIQLYIKNKIHQYAHDIYSKLLSTNTPKLKIDTEKLFETVEFSVNLNKLPSKDVINDLSSFTKSGFKLYYSFVESKKIKQQFYIYPDNYFGSNLLKTKYTININLDIIELMLQNNSNILVHNNEKLSPLVMMIKNNYYEAFKIIKDNFDMSSYDNNYDNTNNYHSPQYYLMENFKNHLDNYNRKILESQYTEMNNIIQSNESYYNNILKYMDVSFNVVKYIVHQYITENMIRFSDDFNSDSLQKLLTLLEFDINEINNIGKCQYNDNLGSKINIPDKDEDIIINEFKQELNKKIDESIKILTKYNKERAEIVGLKMNTTIIDNKIQNIQNKIANYRTQLASLNSGGFVILNPQPNIDNFKIISRYDNLRNRIGIICYMEGWKQFIENTFINNIEKIPLYLINYQNTENTDDVLQNIDIIHKFYKHNYNIIKIYFENQRYIDDNKVLGFVYDLLVHLTKTFICSNISSIIKKILYEYIVSTQNIQLSDVFKQIDLMVDGIDDVLYNIIPKKFVRNSVNIYMNEDDEASNPIESVSEILNNLIDLLNTKSDIPINDYTINILKNSINPYFDTITYKLINNWNVVIENIFLFHINQYRILECIIQLHK